MMDCSKPMPTRESRFHKEEKRKKAQLEATVFVMATGKTLADQLTEEMRKWQSILGPACATPLEPLDDALRQFKKALYAASILLK